MSFGSLKKIQQPSMVNYLSIFICMSLKCISYVIKCINFDLRFYFPNIARAFPEITCRKCAKFPKLRWWDFNVELRTMHMYLF